MSDKRKLINYYKRKMYGGRSMVARVVDFIALRLILFVCMYLWFKSTVSNGIMAVLLALATLGFLCVAIELIKSIRLDRFLSKERRRIGGELLRKKLLLFTKDEQLEHIRKFVKAHPDTFSDHHLIYTACKAAPVSEDDILCACRAARNRGCTMITVFHTSEIDKHATLACSGYQELRFQFVRLEVILSEEEKRRLIPKDAEIDKSILEELRLQKARRKETASLAFSSGRTWYYLLAAAGLFAASFFVKYPLYYRMVAAACVSFGTISFFISGSAQRGH